MPLTGQELHFANQIDGLLERVNRLEKRLGGRYMNENSLTKERAKPERPAAWYRWGGSALAPIFSWGDWPPPEPDDVAWYPLYSSPEGRPAVEPSALRKHRGWCRALHVRTAICDCGAAIPAEKSSG
jgi:hypothetical protein